MIFKGYSNKKFIKDVAILHKKYLKTGFLSSLGEKFLFYLYEAMCNSKSCFLFFYIENNEVIGFVSGTQNLNKFYKIFFKKYFFKILISIIPHLFSYTNIRKILEIIFYIRNNSVQLPNLPDAELLSIVVKDNCSKKGIGKKLFLSLIEEFKKRKVNQFKIIVGKELKNAVKFYDSIGAEKIGEFQLHKNEMSIIYVYKIK